jgi:hypothetical protein
MEDEYSWEDIRLGDSATNSGQPKFTAGDSSVDVGCSDVISGRH